MYRKTLGLNQEEDRKRDYRLGELGLALGLPGLALEPLFLLLGVLFEQDQFF